MVKKKKPLKNKKNLEKWIKKPFCFILPEKIKKWIWGVVIFVLAIIIVLSFFDLAGIAGRAIMEALTFLIGRTVFIIPVILVFGGLIFFRTKYDNFLGPTILAISILTVGAAGILGSLTAPEIKQGGYLGYLISLPFLKLFGQLVSQIIFGGVILAGFLIFWHLLGLDIVFWGKEKKPETGLKEDKPLLLTQIFKKVIGSPKFKVKKIEPRPKEILTPEEPGAKAILSELKTKPINRSGSEYKAPPLDLLAIDKGKPSAGDTVTNSVIIKKTLEDFGLRVEMSEINIGPTVTQYALKPAEGIKLSKIIALSNNLSLALASHPIRIEAPIPGKSLVGIEVSNKERCYVRLRDLISNPRFQRDSFNLIFVLGRDVSNNPCYADLSKMPHLLVAGSTGTGKTIFLNSLILSLLYQNSPEILRIILIDPKRVEFSAYQELPHLLTPVIFDPQNAINVLKWLISEMERRFDVLSGNGSRNISSYNEKILKEKGTLMPYIVLIVDELADLMVARGREVEAGIVRLAQMARAVGIHLVVATQRPSVEVITGLIKANITSRVTFQVASQIDSRTVLDMAGAEKLLGAGDFLFLSAEIAKPKRIQGAYVAEKEVKKVVDYIKTQNPKTKGQDLEEEIIKNQLSREDLGRRLNGEEGEFERGFNEEDPLYEEAKRTVIEVKKASASLLQRRLRIGYARAARLLDVLEERRVVGPGEGAKPREVYLPRETEDGADEEGWQKV